MAPSAAEDTMFDGTMPRIHADASGNSTALGFTAAIDAAGPISSSSEPRITPTNADRRSNDTKRKPVRRPSCPPARLEAAAAMPVTTKLKISGTSVILSAFSHRLPTS